LRPQVYDVAKQEKTQRIPHRPPSARHPSSTEDPMKIRRFDRRTFVRKTLAQSALAGRTQLDMRIVKLNKVPANATGVAGDSDAQLQAQASHATQDR
jgi:hypothetical protein